MFIKELGEIGGGRGRPLRRPQHGSAGVHVPRLDRGHCPALRDRAVHRAKELGVIGDRYTRKRE